MSTWLIVDCLVLSALALLVMVAPPVARRLFTAMIYLPGDPWYMTAYIGGVPIVVDTHVPRESGRAARRACEGRRGRPCPGPGHAAARAPLHRRQAPCRERPVLRRLSPH